MMIELARAIQAVSAPLAAAPSCLASIGRQPSFRKLPVIVGSSTHTPKLHPTRRKYPEQLFFRVGEIKKSLGLETHKAGSLSEADPPAGAPDAP